jgi:glycogen synthase
MNILMVNTLYYPTKVGGAEVSVQLLAEGLVKKSHKVTILCFHDNNKDVGLKEYHINGVDVISLPWSNVYWPFNKGPNKKNIIKKIFFQLNEYYNIKLWTNIISIIKKVNPDVVHTHNIFGFSPVIWTAAKRENKPVIHTTRDYYLFNPNCILFKNGKNQNPSDIIIKLIGIPKKWATRSVDSFVSISNFVSKLHLEYSYFPKASSHVIYNAVNEIKRVPASVKTNFNQFVVGYLGKISEEKGIEEYLKMASLLHSRDASISFKVAGSITEEKKEFYVKKFNCDFVEFLGFTKPEDFFSKIDVLAICVLWNEPFGRTVIESTLTYGIPVVGFPNGGIAEVLELTDNYIVDDYRMMADTIENMKLNKIEMKSYHDKTIFHIDTHVESYEKVYNEFI